MISVLPIPYLPWLTRITCFTSLFTKNFHHLKDKQKKQELGAVAFILVFTVLNKTGTPSPTVEMPKRYIGVVLQDMAFLPIYLPRIPKSPPKTHR